jgi:hypothetical protein
MCARLHLQVALAGVLAVVVLERPLDVHRVRVVPFNEVGVVAVHRSHEVCKRGQKGRGQAATEASGFLGEVERKVGESARCREPSPMSSGSIRETGSPRSAVFMSAFMAACKFNTTISISVRYGLVKET